MSSFKFASRFFTALFVPVLSIIFASSHFSVARSLQASTPAPEHLFEKKAAQVFAKAGDDVRCLIMTQCEERLGCDPDEMLPYDQPIPSGYFTGCSVSLVDAKGNVRYFNFLDGGFLWERTIDGVTVANLNPHMSGKNVKISVSPEVLENTDFVLLHIAYIPWPLEIPCESEIAYQCATVTPQVSNLPALYQP